MSTLSCGFPQGRVCYWDLTAQLSNSGVCFLWDNWKVLIPPFRQKNECLWRNRTRLNRAFSTPALQKRGKVLICCRKCLLFPRDWESTLILLFSIDSTTLKITVFSGKLEHFIDFVSTIEWNNYRLETLIRTQFTLLIYGWIYKYFPLRTYCESMTFKILIFFLFPFISL